MEKSNYIYSFAIRFFKDMQSLEPDLFESFSINIEDIDSLRNISSFKKAQKIVKKYTKDYINVDQYALKYCNTTSLTFFYKTLKEEYQILYKLNIKTLFALIKNDLEENCI